MGQNSLGGLIRALRKENDLTQAMLAEKLCVTDKAVSKWERDLSFPDISLFPKLADVLGVTVEDLLQQCAPEENPSRLRQIIAMSHDVRTPLHIILGYADLAVKYHEDTPRLLRYLENIQVSGEHLLKVIDHLMDVAYRDNGGALPFGGQAAWEAFLSPPSDRTGAGESYDFSGRRVLLAEDIELNREIAFEILTQTGVEVEFAEDGQICVDKLTAAPAGHYDLILMDIKMPNMDGMEATRRIRQLADPARAGIPIIAMTANVYEKDRLAALQAGMNDFTEKPIMTEKLFAAMKKYL